MPSLRWRVRDAVARARTVNTRGLLAIAGIACVAIGLSMLSVILSWLVVGVFLLVAAGSGPTRAAP